MWEQIPPCNFIGQKQKPTFMFIEILVAYKITLQKQ